MWLRRVSARPSLRLCSSSRRSFSSKDVASIPEKVGETVSEAGEAVKETISQARSNVQRMWDAYAGALTDYPIRANGITSGVLCGGGDALAQYFEWRLGISSPDKQAYNWPRTARMTLWGTAIGGPVLALWYRGLHSTAEGLSISYAPLVSGRFASLAGQSKLFDWVTSLHRQVEVVPLSPMKVLMGKVVVDSMLFQAPYLNLYFGVISFLEGLSPSEILEKTRASFHRAWALSFMVWTPVQAVNLYFVPVPFQPCIVAAVNVGWNTTLSLLNHYHDYGSPRVQAAPTHEGGGDYASANAGHRTVGNGDSAQGGAGSVAAVQAARAAEHAAWERERSQLRVRIAQLLAENKSLRLQLGQMHAASFQQQGSRSHER